MPLLEQYGGYSINSQRATKNFRKGTTGVYPIKNTTTHQDGNSPASPSGRAQKSRQQIHARKAKASDEAEHTMSGVESVSFGRRQQKTEGGKMAGIPFPSPRKVADMHARAGLFKGDLAEIVAQIQVPILMEALGLDQIVPLVAAVLAVAFGLWTQLAYSQNVISWLPLAIAVISWVAALGANRIGREGWAFLFSAITQGGVVIFLFCALYPYVMPSAIQPAASLTITNASSTEYTLKVMTWVAVIMTPVVLAYQAWTYWVFRRRLHPDQITDPSHGSLDLPHEISV